MLAERFQFRGALDLMRGIKANSAFPPMLSARKVAN